MIPETNLILVWNMKLLFNIKGLLFFKNMKTSLFSNSEERKRKRNRSRLLGVLKTYCQLLWDPLLCHAPRPSFTKPFLLWESTSQSYCVASKKDRSRGYYLPPPFSMKSPMRLLPSHQSNNSIHFFVAIYSRVQP